MRIIKNKFSVVSLLLIVLLNVSSIVFLLPEKAQAAELATWIDNFNISYKGQIFQSDDHNDNWKFYWTEDPESDCKDVIDDINWKPRNAGDSVDDPSDDDTTAKYQKREKTADGCVNIGNRIDLDLSASGNATKTFVWDGEFIVSTDGQPFIFGWDEDLGLYSRGGYDSTENNCRDTFETTTGGAAGLLTIRVNEGAGNYGNDLNRTNKIFDSISGFAAASLFDYKANINGCYVSETIEIRLYNPENAKNPGEGSVSGLNPEDQQTVVRDSCATGGGSFSFFLCPLLRGATGAIEILDSQIRRSLNVDVYEYGSNQDGVNGLQGIKGAWARVRNIAYILLIPILLVMVIGTALGFQFVDAYTVKRAMPRLFIAVIFMALSFNICVLLVEFTNVIGAGIGGIIAAPFGGLEALTLDKIFNPDGVAEGAVSLGILGGIGIALFTPAILGIVASYLFVAALVLGIIFAVLAIRELLIIFLIILSPIAILAWIFPGNDKPWNLWRLTFMKLLMIYPLIVGLLVAGRALASVIPPSDGINGVFNILAKLTLYIGPFFFIITAFRYAGGVIGNLAGRINDKSRGVFDRQRNWRSKRAKQEWDRNYGRRLTQQRADLKTKLQNQASKDGRSRIGRYALGRAAGAVGGYNIDAQDSGVRAQVGKELNEQIATGKDDEIRGLTVDKRTANSRLKDGKRQFQTLGGGWVDEAAVDAGYRRWGKDSYAKQAALSYEMRKASSEEDVERIRNNYGALATGAWGLNDNQAGGAWIGAAFENQNQHLEFKHTRWQDGSMSEGGASSFAEEAFEKKGSYQMSQMHASTIKRLKEAYDIADSADDEATKAKIRGVAETFVSRYGASSGSGVAALEGEEGKQQVIYQQQPGQSQQPTTQTIVTNTPGAGHVAQNVRDLAVHVGVLRPLDPSTEIYSAQPPNSDPRQN